MPGRRGLIRVVSDALAALIRLPARRRIVFIPLIDRPRAQRIVPQRQPIAASVDCAVISNPRSVSLGLRDTPIRRLHSEEPRNHRVSFGFRARMGEMPTVGPHSASLGVLSCELAPSSAEAIPISIAADSGCRALSFGISEPSVLVALPPAPHVSRTEGIDLFRRMSARRNLQAIYRQPLVLSSIPWNLLDRDMILASWELLRGQAVEALGHDPGRALEMLAIFPEVDLGGIERTSFDPVRRELHLFPDWRYAGRERGSRWCAIIAGAVKGTGELVEVAMPIGAPSDSS